MGSVLVRDINNRAIIYIIAALICFHGFISGWAVSGMETVFYAMLVSLFIYCILNNKTKFLPYIITAIVLTRHDGVLLLPVYLFYNYKNKKEWISVVIIISVYYLWRYYYYGDIIPHVMQIKNSTSYYHGNPVEMLQYWLLYGSAVLFALIASFNKKQWVLYAYCGIASLVYAFGIRADLVRYSVHLLPVMLILILSVKHNKQFIYALIVLFASNTYMSYGKYHNFSIDYRETQKARQEIGQLVKETIPENEKIISGDIGIIAYTAINHKFVDMVGLTSKPDITNARFIADTFNLNLQGRVPGQYKPIKIIQIPNKPYCIALCKQ